jgi:hypothetical protein
MELSCRGFGPPQPSWVAIATSDSGTRRPGISIKLSNLRRLFVTTVTAGLLAWTHGTANATLLPGEGVGLYADLQSIGDGYPRTMKYSTTVRLELSVQSLNLVLQLYSQTTHHSTHQY